jgi:hypothetical protein
MNAEDYLSGVRADSDHVRLSGKRQETSWEPELAEAMERENRAVYEEAVTDTLLADWSYESRRRSSEAQEVARGADNLSVVDV